MTPVNPVAQSIFCLLTDDSPTVRRVARRFLEGSEYEIDEAENGQAALDKCAVRLPDVVLLDWNMPVMNGLDMLTQMRAAGYTDTKVMMVTTEAENDFIVRALDAGADEYLMKPFDDEALTEKLAMLGLVEA